ncbi:bis-aminopropyl spermidine synthase family protein [Paenibacillus paeoniae]|uniref:Putative methyltransferase n=1 Tax=Paenibacillus paeoniae TaxID=2292705 RepID=A0A371PFN2_9BACL|nr:bis-aminopropyl spermidine synthase family protein [Paenibacillus paeoniae]REK74761.1 putative methyltransferase [Paenibacillus paeoniae]
MKNYVEQVNERMTLQEGTQVVEQLLLESYLHPGISTKELARKTLLPVPVAAAVKRELIKTGALIQERGVRCTGEGAEWIEREWGYEGLDRSFHQALLQKTEWDDELNAILAELETLFPLRPTVDVRIDQSKCTPETSLRRAILCLKQHSLIGKRILCIGDDDLVSVAIGLLLQRLFPSGGHTATTIDVMDIDDRFIRYIEEVAKEYHLPIHCHRVDFREQLPLKLCGQYDAFFTDPPYTLQGMSLFVSRGIQAMKRIKGLPIFLSFAHKSPTFMLAMQREFVRMGLTVCANFPHFNEYEAAEMIANRSQMFILRTTDQTEPEHIGIFTDALYTGEVRQTLRTYQCKQCAQQIYVGIHGQISTIEQLKNEGCPSCSNDTFDMIEKRAVSEFKDFT